MLSDDVAAALRKLLAASGLDRYSLARARVRSCNDDYAVCSLDGEPGRGGVPPLIVKAPVRRRPAAVESLNHEVRVMRYLRGLEDDQLSRIPPEIQAHDADAGIVIMEDLAVSRAARSLHDLLMSPGSAEACAGLARLANTLAKLHRDTRHRPESARAAGVREWSIVTQSVAGGAAGFARGIRSFGVRCDADARREVEEIHALLTERAALSFCHGDIHPQNVFIGPAGIHFCDFELSGFQHPVLEGWQAGWMFPISVDAGSLPREVVDGLRSGYLRERALEDRGDGRRDSGRGGSRLEIAALIAFSVYHWTYTDPGAGLPISMAGARTKVLELARRLEMSEAASFFPATMRVLLRLRDVIASDGALAPDASQPYVCFAGAASSEPSVDTTGPRPPAAAGAMPTGLFRVNRKCHLLVRRTGGARLTVRVVERPQIHCTAYATAEGALQAIEMPLRLAAIDRSHAEVRDLRTQQATVVVRRWMVLFAILHVRQAIRFLCSREVRGARSNVDG